MPQLNSSSPVARLNRRTFLRSAGAYAAVIASPFATVAGRSSQQERELSFLTLKQASELVAKRRVSSRELTRACLDRINQLNPVLHAFITVTDEEAMAQAEAADQEIGRGHRRGSLHGIPVGLKDNIDTAGIPTTAASAAFADRVPSQDAEVVRRLKAAGAVILGKLNLGEFAHNTGGSHFGTVRNPWNLDRIAGGSSNGNAAALATDLCYGALGTDTGASIRWPAACCGVVGLKPTVGRVSARGVIPDSYSFDHVGPMARTVMDVALILSIIAGYDPEDPVSLDAPAEDYAKGLRQSIAGLRLGRVLFDGKPDTEPGSEFMGIIHQAFAALRSMTAGWEELSLPSNERLFSSVADTEGYAFHAERLAQSPQLYDPTTREALLDGKKSTIANYIQGRRELDLVRRGARKIFAKVDLLVSATMPRPPMRIAECREAFPESLNLGEFNILGLPAISIPCGFTSTGFPVGLQIVGPPMGESRVLALAYAYEQANSWWKRHPKL